MSEKAMRAHRRRDPLSVFLRVIVWLAALVTVGGVSGAGRLYT